MPTPLNDWLRQQEPTNLTITPHVGLLTLQFQLYGCSDLKEKRKVFNSLRQTVGREPDLAIAETGDQDALDRATWTIAALGPSSQQIDQRLDQIEKMIAGRVDAPIIDVQRERL